MATKADTYFKTSKSWREELTKLRAVLLRAKIDEDFKWGKPCYSHNGSNIAIIQPFKACLALMFFKGALLKDPKGILVDNGPNSQAARRLEFTSAQEISKLSSTINAFVKAAIEIEASGQKVEFKKNPEPAPDELKAIFAKNPKFKKAFFSLTPGRQRAYILHFSGAKQSTTRQSRIEKYLPRILDGKGINDR